MNSAPITLLAAMSQAGILRLILRRHQRCVRAIRTALVPTDSGEGLGVAARLRVRPESGLISVRSPMGPRLAGVEGVWHTLLTHSALSSISAVALTSGLVRPALRKSPAGDRLRKSKSAAFFNRSRRRCEIVSPCISTARPIREATPRQCMLPNRNAVTCVVAQLRKYATIAVRVKPNR